MEITILLVTAGTASVPAFGRATLGLRIPAEKEQEGLDQGEHGEHGDGFYSARADLLP